jgi:pyruvate/2-oxoglutarate dehydrogenase complex dihydrolipoamide dehydrogenase (E3) component/uncharacterized membrane protein YdjX (TVP38/TMEM64 family)
MSGPVLKKIVVAALIVGALSAFFLLDVRAYLSLDFFRAQRDVLQAYVAQYAFRATALYFLIYVTATGLSLPGAATVLTLAGGALFGLLWGTVVVSFAASLGATLAFLASRFLLRDWVQGRFQDRLATLNDGIRKDGSFYLFALRLLPAIPFFAINLAMGLTPMRARTFYWVSQLGMLPGTALYVYAGTQLGRFEITGRLVLALALLGIFPLCARWVLAGLKARRVYARWPKPSSFERNVVVIGGGSAGLVAAYIAAAVKAKVTLVEKTRMGGDCLNTGCVPSKALIRSARLLAEMRRSGDFGLGAASAEVDFATVMERVQRVIGTIEPHDSTERFSALGVECLHGTATIRTPWTVEVALNTGGTRLLTTRSIVIAAGASPFVPPIPGLREVGPLTSDTIWDLRELPKRLVVLGGGPIGSELGQCFARFGSEVTIVEMLPHLLFREDREVSMLIEKQFAGEGIRVLAGHTATGVVVENGEKLLVVEHAGSEKRIRFDAILCALGRRANTQGFGLETLAISLSTALTIDHNEYLQTLYPNIYACGDVAGPYQFTHTASHQAWYAAVNALFGSVRKFKADYRAIPWATFTEPEVARVGVNEAEAQERGIAHEVVTYALDELDRAITDEERSGFVKVLTVPGKDRILGATIVGARAGDLITEFTLAMRHGLGLSKLLGTIHVYPTFAEAARYAAGNWKRSHTSPRTLAWLERYHRWMRA